MSSFPGKHCWVRSGVYNYTWVPISSLWASFPCSTNNTNSCTRRAQPNHSSWAELSMEASSAWPSTGCVKSCIITLTISCWLCGWNHESAQTNSWSLTYSPPLVFSGLKRTSEWLQPNQVWVSLSPGEMNNVFYCGQGCVNYCGHMLVGVYLIAFQWNSKVCQGFFIFLKLK